MITLPDHWPRVLTSFLNGRFRPVSGLGGGGGGQIWTKIYTPNRTPVIDAEPADPSVIHDAVRYADRAQRSWARIPGLERGRILSRVAAMLNDQKQLEMMAYLDTIDTARPIAETRSVDVVSARDCLEYFAGVAATSYGESLPVHSNGSFMYTRREPLGVTAGIGAWNYPLQCCTWKVAPALAFGNAIIYKPAEDTILSALALAELFQHAGLPDGLFQVVLGAGDVGRLLVEHDGIAKVSFTGSVATGLRIQSDCGSMLKRTTMELGGKGALVIFSDSNLDDAVSTAMLSNFYSNGQVCSNATRLYIEASIFEQFVSEFVRRTKLLRIGDPLDPSTQISALINTKHRDRVVGFIKQGLAEGARIVCGGLDKDLDDPSNAIVKPTIFIDCNEDMEIVKQEIFGPVACVMPFESEEEVIKRANNTPYGLAAGVFTKDIQRGHRIVSELKAGVCYLNNYNITPVEMPWGGIRKSGIGRENGSAAVHSWTELKSVYVEMGPVSCPWP